MVATIVRAPLVSVDTTKPRLSQERITWEAGAKSF